MTIRMRPGFEDLLSIRARITREGVTPTRSSTSRYEFGRGAPDPASFPYDELVEATARMMKAEGPEAMTYGEPQGYLGLRELICHKYELFENMQVGPENILITNGSGHALGLAFSAFVDIDDWVICESPTFPAAVNHLRRHGAKVLDVPLDDEGIDTSAVRERLAALKRQGRRCKMIYTIANFQNPAGPTMSLRRRQELAGLAREFETLIVEDDAYGELRFEGEQLPSLYALDDSGRVVRSGTLSKILGAGTRLGWLCAPPEMIPHFQKFNFGGGVSPFMSRVATYYLRDNLAEHIAMLRDVYRAKRDATRRGLWEELEGTDVEINKPEGGFFIWIKLPTGTNPNQLSELAAEERIQYTRGTAFFPNGGGEQFIRLSFSYDTVENLYEGAKVMGRLIRESIM